MATMRARRRGKGVKEWKKRRPARLKVIWDVDGVLLDYNAQMARMIKKALGWEPALIEPRAHHFKTAYGVELCEADRALVYAEFDQLGWRSMPGQPGAARATRLLARAGHFSLCLSSMPKRFEACRLINLRALGMPIQRVIGSGREEGSEANPKAEHIERERPDVFVDDQLRNFKGLPPEVFKVWIDTGRVDGPNVGADASLADAVFSSALEFAQALAAHPERFVKKGAAKARGRGRA